MDSIRSKTLPARSLAPVTRRMPIMFVQYSLHGGFKFSNLGTIFLGLFFSIFFGSLGVFGLFRELHVSTTFLFIDPDSTEPKMLLNNKLNVQTTCKNVLFLSGTMNPTKRPEALSSHWTCRRRAPDVKATGANGRSASNIFLITTWRYMIHAVCFMNESSW